MGGTIAAIPGQEVIGFLGFNAHLVVEIKEAILVSLVFDLAFSVSSERLQNRFVWEETVEGESGAKTRGDLRG